MFRLNVFVICVAMVIVWQYCLAQNNGVDLNDDVKIKEIENHNLETLKVLRSKRSLFTWHDLLQCKWGYWAAYSRGWALQGNGGYGCYCGSTYLGSSSISSGKAPVDAIDECCYNHDVCWNEAETKYGIWNGWFTEPCTGYWHHYDFNSRTCACSSSANECRGALCACDAAFADCIEAKWNSYTSHKSCP